VPQKWAETFDYIQSADKSPSSLLSLSLSLSLSLPPSLPLSPSLSFSFSLFSLFLLPPLFFFLLSLARARSLSLSLAVGHVTNVWQRPLCLCVQCEAPGLFCLYARSLLTQVSFAYILGLFCLYTRSLCVQCEAPGFGFRVYGSGFS